MEKQTVNSGKVTISFIGHFILYFICASVVLGFIVSFITAILSNGAFKTILTLILIILIGFFTLYLSCKLATFDAFKKYRLEENEVPTLVRNIIIFFVIILILSFIPTITTYMDSVKILSTLHISAVSTDKTILLSTMIVGMIANIIYYICMIPIEKKFITKYNV